MARPGPHRGCCGINSSFCLSCQDLPPRGKDTLPWLLSSLQEGSAIVLPHPCEFILQVASRDSWGSSTRGSQKPTDCDPGHELNPCPLGVQCLYPMTDVPVSSCTNRTTEDMVRAIFVQAIPETRLLPLAQESCHRSVNLQRPQGLKPGRYDPLQY